MNSRSILNYEIIQDTNIEKMNWNLCKVTINASNRIQNQPDVTFDANIEGIKAV